MTNSTDNAKKSKKTKGPLRFEAIIPTLIVVALIYAYFFLFFDSNLRSALEWTGSQVHGAEVNIKKIQSSFWKGYLQVDGIQITDKEKPEQNLLQIGKIRFDLLWDALLRAKFVVENATIENIQVYVPRKSPGHVLPKDSPNNKALQKVEDSVLDQAKDDFNENVLGDVANLMDGTDPNQQLNKIQTNLKADQKIKELEKDLADKKKLWNDRLNKLPQKKEIDALVERAKKIKLNTKDPLKLARDLKEIDKIYKEGDKIVKEFERTSKALSQDVSSFNGNINNLDQLAKKDLADLQKRLKIPNLNVADFSMGLFGRMFQTKLAGLKKYMAIAREYMPPEKTAEQKQQAHAEKLIPRQRGAGKNFNFPQKKGYPLFWLKYAKITSEPTSSEFSGRIKGEIHDVTSDPVLLNRQTTATLDGDFPKQGIKGLHSKVTIDHRTNEAYEKLEATIDHYPLGLQTLSNSDDVRLALKNADGKMQMDATLKNSQLFVKINNQFTQPEYDVQAKSKNVDDILKGIVNGIPLITVNASATGSWEKINWNINSNLGDELSKGFKKQVQVKIDAAKKKLEEQVFGQLNKEKAKLRGEFNKIKGGLDKQIKGKRNELNKAKQQAQTNLNSQKKTAEKSTNKKVEKAGKKALKDLKNALGL